MCVCSAPIERFQFYRHPCVGSIISCRPIQSAKPPTPFRWFCFIFVGLGHGHNCSSNVVCVTVKVLFVFVFFLLPLVFARCRAHIATLRTSETHSIHTHTLMSSTANTPCDKSLSFCLFLPLWHAVSSLASHSTHTHTHTDLPLFLHMFNGLVMGSAVVRCIVAPLFSCYYNRYCCLHFIYIILCLKITFTLFAQ